MALEIREDQLWVGHRLPAGVGLRSRQLRSADFYVSC